MVIILIAGGIFYYKNMLQAPSPSASAEYKNAFYTVEGKQVRLVNGVYAIPTAPGSSSMITTKYFGNEIHKDLNGDGRQDVAFLLTQEAGGSGTFFYVVAALNLPDGYKGSQAFFLGDRIAPETSESGPGNSIVVNYAERKFGEPMTAEPSMGKSLRLILDTNIMQFGQVADNFEGEADPSRMTLGMKIWDWIETTEAGHKIVPKTAGKFSLTFSGEGRFSAKTDCNGVAGDYSAQKNSLVFGRMVSTLMYCEGSQESEFNSLLTDTKAFHFTSKGELILELKDGGTATFK